MGMGILHECRFDVVTVAAHCNGIVVVVRDGRRLSNAVLAETGEKKERKREGEKEQRLPT